MSGGEHIIVLSRDDTAAFLAAVADVEAIVDGAGEEDVKLDVAAAELSRIASLVGGQVDAQ